MTRIRLVVFDLFGTLLDIASLSALAAPIVGAERADDFVRIWREKQIAYSFAASLMGRYEDFDTITRCALDYALASLGLAPTAAMRATLNEGWFELRPHPDATLGLEGLRSQRIRTAVLTNGTLGTAKRALANAGLAEFLDDVWSVDEIGIYKPSPRVYALVCERTGLQPARVAFVSSNGWDATGAAAFGFFVVWCNRRGVPAEAFGPPPAATVRTLDELAALVGALPLT
ncbi:MAG: haloacid dehalogenase type II [Candidatus Eremiobacteraeota bacterium]|nr:haloacid dehalogenase type II [Candidatus Eremiobacteraeota bacterium]